MPRTTPWDKIEGGEYNEHRCIVDGRTVVVYSNRDGTEWHYTLDGAGPFRCEADIEFEARREAERAAAS
jgi:hypothetical protein